MKQQKPENLMRASFPSRSVNEGLARSLVASFAALADPTVEELCDIKTAVSEAVTNAIVHGYRDTMGQVYIAAALYPGDRLVITASSTCSGTGAAASPMWPRPGSPFLPPAPPGSGRGWASPSWRN